MKNCVIISIILLLLTNCSRHKQIPFLSRGISINLPERFTIIENLNDVKPELRGFFAFNAIDSLFSISEKEICSFIVPDQNYEYDYNWLRTTLDTLELTFSNVYPGGNWKGEGEIEVLNNPVPFSLFTLDINGNSYQCLVSLFNIKDAIIVYVFICEDIKYLKTGLKILGHIEFDPGSVGAKQW